MRGLTNTALFFFLFIFYFNISQADEPETVQVTDAVKAGVDFLKSSDRFYALYVSRSVAQKDSAPQEPLDDTEFIFLETSESKLSDLDLEEDLGPFSRVQVLGSTQNCRSSIHRLSVAGSAGIVAGAFCKARHYSNRRGYLPLDSEDLIDISYDNWVCGVAGLLTSVVVGVLYSSYDQATCVQVLGAISRGSYLVLNRGDRSVLEAVATKIEESDKYFLFEATTK